MIISGITYGPVSITARDEYYLDYWQKYRTGWIEGEGGKLYGLAGGAASTGCDPIVANGWSARYMWDSMRLYLYDQNRVDVCGDSYGFSPSVLPVNVWTRLTMRVKINTPNVTDGIIQIWVNGNLAYSRTNIRLRGNVSSSTARVDKIFMQPFRGGNDASWSVPADTTIDFKPAYLLDCLPVFTGGNETLEPTCGGAPPTPDYTTGLRMHLKFDEGTDSTAEDSTANNHDGTLGAGNSWGAAKMGTSAVTYDGTANGVVTVAGGLTNPTAATLAAWVFPTAWPTTTNGVVNVRDAVIIRLQDSGSVRGSFYTGTGFSGVTVPVGMPLNTWTHVAYTMQAGTQVVYVNGVAVGSANDSTPVSYTGRPADTVLGSHPTQPANFRFQGRIDDVRVYTRALTATDIAGLAALQDPAPLSVQITTPTTNDAYSTSAPLLANVGGVASDNVGVTGVTWTCPTCATTSGPATCDPACGAATTFTNWTIPSIDLASGTNLVTVIASDAGSTKTDTLTVTYTPPPPVGTCTHYASTSGTGNGLATGTPFQIANFWTAIASTPAGKTLCLLDGTYTGGNGMIQPPANLSGTASLPITIQAINDGAVLLDGQNARNPVVIAGTNQWYVVQGINARNGLTGVYQFLGSNNRGKRLIGWNATSGQANAVIFEVQGINTIVEDCAGWGDNARTVFQGSGLATSTGSGYRRCWGEFNDHPTGGTALPGATFQPGVGQFLENVLGTVRKTGD
jgi:hypothetical protein